MNLLKRNTLTLRQKAAACAAGVSLALIYMAMVMLLP
jgi:hypothetical protein